MAEQTSLFISDVHLGAFDKATEKEIEDELIALINHCCEQKIKIYILGDLFDYWMEYPKKIHPNCWAKSVTSLQKA